jgi:hypothetical protein
MIFKLLAEENGKKDKLLDEKVTMTHGNLPDILLGLGLWA